MRRLLSALVLLLAVGLVMLGWAGRAQAGVPNRLYGTVILNGQPAAVGTTIVALAAGKPCATVTVTALAVSGTSYPYRMDVPDGAADAACKPGAVVTFTVGGATAAQTFTLDDTGAFQRLDLTAPGTPAAGATASRTVSLPVGCGEVVSSFPDNTPAQDVALAVTPNAAVAGIWVVDRGTGRYRGFHPNAVDFSDLRTINRGEAMRVCVGAPAGLTQP